MSEPVLGGWVICRPAPIKYNGKDWIGFTLLSDIHFGVPNNDEDRLRRELEEAKNKGDRIAINGDVFDGIITSDPRFSADILHPRLQGRNDILNAAVDMAVDWLAPYAGQIDMIGCGNHENTVSLKSSVDLTALLIDRLQPAIPDKLRHTHVIHHGGYAGFLDYRFRYATGKRGGGRRYVISYFHGSGGGSGAGKGVANFHKRMWVRCDLMWMGHQHMRTSVDTAVMECPQDGDSPVIKERRHIMTSAYGKIYHGQSQDSIKKHGRRSSWAADRMGFAPEGLGGARVELLVNDKRPQPRVRVIQ